jgi:disulfide bond formation protein DsbB
VVEPERRCGRLVGIDASQVADIEGTAATAGVFLLVALVGLRVLAPARFAVLRGHLEGTGLAMGGGVAVLATAGSLWFSEGAHFPPCELCWYQRIAMYPLAVVLPLAAWRGDRPVRFYGIVLASIGLVISAWHNVVETFPERDLSGGCDPTNPCTIRWVEGLGFWTIPRMALVAFALVLAALLLDRPNPEET